MTMAEVIILFQEKLGTIFFIVGSGNLSLQMQNKKNYK